MTHTTIGIDISKEHLDVHRLADSAERQFANTRAGHKVLIKWLGAKPAITRIVYEPTGPYHRDLERALAIAGLPLAKSLPPRRRGSTRDRQDASPKPPVNLPRQIVRTQPCSHVWAKLSPCRHVPW